MIPKLTDAQEANLGYLSSVTVTQGTGYTNPTAAVTGGTGFGARIKLSGTGAALVASVIDPGKGYNPGSPVTITITDAGGSGATITGTLHGPDEGMVIYNTTRHCFRLYTNNGFVNIGQSSLVDGGDFTGQTTFTTLNTYTVPSDGTYELSGWIDITAISGGNTLGFTYNFTDQNNNAQTGSLYANGSTSPTQSATGYYPQVPMTVKAKAGTTIRINTAGTTGGSMTYDAGTLIKRLR